MLDRRRYNPVRPWSAKGKFLAGMVRTAFAIRRRLGGKDWISVWPEHHEDPRHMTRKELIYFSHKYYYRAITSPEEKSKLGNHFRVSSGALRTDPGFQALNEITLSAGGDLMPYASINPATCSSLWNEIGDYFFGADIVTANLETPIDLTKKASMVPEVMLNHMYFNGSEEMFGVFSGNAKWKGYDVLSIANNHSLDQGTEGLLRTMEFLERKNIRYCGARKNVDELNDVTIIEKNGIRTAFLAATFSLNAETLPTGKEWMVDHLFLNRNNPDISRLISQAKKAREMGADLLIAHLHMGCAYQPYPSEHTCENIRRICRETGIDIVLGGHPHNPQPIEFIDVQDPFSGQKKQSFIVYSMGDFVAYDIFKWCHLPLILKFRIGKNENETRITGIEIKMLYNHAEIKNGNIQSLCFLDMKKILENNSVIRLDDVTRKEVEELRLFLNQFLLPGNIEKYLI